MNIAITGASGLIGRNLVQTLSAQGHTVKPLARGQAPMEADAVVHLAGESVAKRWTPETKRRILESRVEGTRNLVAAFGRMEKKPAVLVCASAIGYYGERGEETLDESCARGTGFLAEVCAAWEKEAEAAAALGIRVARMRIGVVLDPRGGALAQMLMPLRLFAGGTLGGGRQWMSWIHRDDLAALFRFAIEHPVRGAINAVAPEAVTNREFTHALAAALHRPAIFTVPAFVLRAAMGEMSTMLLGSQRVVPRAAQNAGFAFRFPSIAPALGDLLGGTQRVVQKT